MKKIFVCLLSVAAIAACQKNQVLETVVGPAIAFENASVDHQTRAAVDPSTTTANISEFSVWGYMDSRNGAVFTEELVSKNGSAWTYANTQYWLAGHTYYFAAVSPVKHADVVVTPETATTAGDYGLGKIDFTNTDGSTDLIYASAMVKAAADADLSAMPKVGLSFSHLLSKVKFTFTNGFENPNSTLKVTAVKMTAPKTGTIDLNVANWWDNDDWKLGNESVTLAFGDVNAAANVAAGASQVADKERLTIPAAATQEYTVTFHVQLYNGEVLAVENDLTATVSGVALEMGKAYNFKTEINANNIMGSDPEDVLYPIEFEVEVKDWVEAGDFGVGQNVETEAELHAAIAKGGEVYLESDIELTKGIEVPAGVNVVVNLNGKTIKNTATTSPTDVFFVAPGAELTLNGEGNVTAVGGNDGYAVYSQGKVTINGGVYSTGLDENGKANACIYVKNNGQAYIFGGEFHSEPGALMLNKHDGTRETTVLNVYGGTYYGFNPADNLSENAGTNFVPAGYKSVETATGVWTVSAE